MAGIDPDRLVPAVNQQPAANWQAIPAGGPAVQLAWGNVRVNGDASNGVYAVWTDTRNNNEDIFAAPLANTDLR